ncbi:MAG: type II CAAX endopeptidase family protein [Eubacteriales bacterium]|nr:type II CAAX endopeptidase family protein [Eubacteriales bacterium]
METMNTTDVQANEGQRLEAKAGMMKSSVFFLILLVLQIPIGLVIGAIAGKFPENHASLISVLITQGYMLISALIYIFATKKSITKDLRVRKYKVSTFFLSIVMLITATPMANLLNIISQFFAKNETSGAILNITEVVPWWLAIMIVGCLPGFIEETIFRGIIHTAFRKRSVLTGIIVSSISFGLMHMNFNQIMYAVYLGVVFALLVEATGSLASTMVLHMLFNGVNTAYIFVLPKLFEYLGKLSPAYANFNLEEQLNQGVSTSQLIMAASVWTPFAIGGLVLTVLLLKVIAKINGRELTWKSICEVKEESRDVKPMNIPMILCWLFCFVFAVIALFA